MVTSLALNFWGTRALVSCAGPDQNQYGGNTSCLQISDTKDPNWFLIINAGFGINNLGETLFSPRPLNLHIFFTDFHWGHLQGLPFFLPIFFEQNHIHLYSPLPSRVLHDRLDILFNPSYSPFEGLTKMPANIECHQMGASTKIGPLEIQNMSLRGKNLVNSNKAELVDERFAYKIRGRSQANITLALTLDPENDDQQTLEEFKKFSKDSSLLVHGATNFSSDIAPYKGRGYAEAQQAAGFAEKCQINRCLFSEHAPGRSDQEISKTVKEIEKKYGRLSFEFAQEMLSYKV